MKNYYSYIFYRFYKIALKGEENWSAPLRMPHLVALILVSVFDLWVCVVLSKLTHANLEKNIVVFYLLIACIFLINYFLFLYKKKYKNIYEIFESEKENVRLIKTIVFWFIIALTVLFMLSF